jgi:hypothetical protein
LALFCSLVTNSGAIQHGEPTVEPRFPAVLRNCLNKQMGHLNNSK